MILHYLTIAWRHLLRNRVYTLINLLGLSIGIASVLIITLYVQKELSFDKFFDDSERIHRIALERIYPDRVRNIASSAITLAPVLKDHYPDVEAVTRIHRMYFVNEMPVHIGEQTYVESQYRYADADFFKVFSHTFIEGDPKTALDALDKVVLTASTARKYFGRTNVLDEIIRRGNDTTRYIVSGVIEDIPVNSHMHFDLIGSIYCIPYLVNAIDNNRWMNPWLFTYVKLREGVDPDKFEAGLDALVDQYGGPFLSQTLGTDYKADGHKFAYFLQPIEKIHLHSRLDIELEPNNNILYVYFLSVIAIIILIISSINYINLSVATSPARAREVGIRKVVGVQRGGLILQFLTESVLICSLSSLLAIGIVYFCLPYFNQLLNTSLGFEPLIDPLALMALLAFIVLVGGLSGLYPATVIAAIQPSRILKGSFKSSSKGRWLRNGLTTLQFSISIIMISGSILVYQQMQYFQEKNLGFDKENILVIQQAGQLGSNYQAFRNEILKIPGVLAAGGANGLPGDFHGSNIFKVSHPLVGDLRANIATFDDDFFETMQFKLVEGRSFGREFNDIAKIMINEAAALSLGLDNAIGAKFRNSNQPDSIPSMTVVGLVEDYNFYSLHSEIGPMIIFKSAPQNPMPKLAVRLKAASFQESIGPIQDAWRNITNSELNYTFLDEDLQKQYESDRATSWVFSFFTYIAIIMCCIGLFGLTTFIAQQRSKEMSIRKVLGASMSSIVLSFSKEFLLLIGIACLIGIPLSYYFMNEWLTAFAYHVEISHLLFIFTAVIMVILIMITVSYQSLKLARINPSEFLRKD